MNKFKYTCLTTGNEITDPIQALDSIINTNRFLISDLDQVRKALLENGGVSSVEDVRIKGLKAEHERDKEHIRNRWCEMPPVDRDVQEHTRRP